MASPLLSLTLVILSSLLHLSNAQNIFINQVPEYYSLGTCAEPALSTIVRDMYSGCGDGGQTTSYDCFCSQSSSHFADVISDAIMSKCQKATAQATTALDVFSSYCKLGNKLSSKTATVTASPTSTAQASAATSSSKTGISTGLRVAIAVLIPLIVFAACIAIFCVMRRRSILRRNGEKMLPSPPPPPYTNQQPYVADSIPHRSYKSELPGIPITGSRGEKQQTADIKAHEMYGGQVPVELSSRHSKIPAELSSRQSKVLVELA